MNLVRVPNILLPNKNIDYSKWSCIACDQFSSEPMYWAELAEKVGDSPSALNLILPEVYLDKNTDDAIKKINQNMLNYLNSDMFYELNSIILVERTLNNGKVRLGLMVEIDLEQYEYTDKNNSYIKATEKTVTSRLPARIEIRKHAELEMPHIMMLIDDKKGDIIEKLYADKQDMQVVYDFDLNMNGGHIRGFKVANSKDVVRKLNSLADSSVIKQKYNNDGNIAFIVGDGNHSLATAKECWNLIKQNLSEKEKLNHKARYSLVEIVNIYDQSLEFEPIHRLLVGASFDFVDSFCKAMKGESKIKVIFDGKTYFASVPENPSDAIKNIQDFIDEYKQNHKEIVEDYIHGDNSLTQLAKKHNAVGIFMPTISKDGLFDYCFRRGALPRKSFSMGNAEDKRYYLESKKIKWLNKNTCIFLTTFHLIVKIIFINSIIL